MAAMDLLGRRWSLRVLWELRDGPVGFRALQKRCDAMSSSVLAARLDELGSAGLVVRDEADRYVLSEIGRDLGTAIAPLTAWAARWGAQLGPRQAPSG
jgi:DNA-binding HxlR family transcriptional regulator